MSSDSCRLQQFSVNVFFQRKEPKQSKDDWSYKVWMENLLKKGLKFNNKMMEK